MQDAMSVLVSPDTVFPVNVGGIHGSLFSGFISELCGANLLRSVQAVQYGGKSGYTVLSGDMVVVVPGEAEAASVAEDLRAFCPDSEINVFPWWGNVPYRPAARGSVVFGKRAGILSRLASGAGSRRIGPDRKSRIFIFTQRAFMSPLPPPEYIRKSTFILRLHDRIDTSGTAEKLAAAGYVRVPKVTVRGEFSLRGEVLDVFLPCDEHATRIVFDFDEIESIREFDADTQTTTGSKESVLIHPMREVVWNGELAGVLRSRLDEYNSSAVRTGASDSGADINNFTDSAEWSVHLPFTEQALEAKERILSSIEISGEAEGEELFYQLLWDRRYSVIDYIDLPATDVIFYDYDRMCNAELSINREFNGMFRKARLSLPVLPPDMMITGFRELTLRVSRCIFFRTLQSDDVSECNENITDSAGGPSCSAEPSLRFDAEPARSFFGNINFMKDELARLQNDGWSVFIFTDSENQRLRIHEIFRTFTDLADGGDVHPVRLVADAVSAGFSVPEIRLLVIQENEIFGRRRYVPKSLRRAKSRAIDTFVELNPGDYVVHVNWGIGLFHGIERVRTMGNERDYIKLEYADEEYAFVPIEQVNLVQRYIGSEGDRPRLDRIGSKSWENRKNKVTKTVEDIARRLIDLYSRRKASAGFAFPKETEWQAAFEAAFPYEDTPDQITVTEEIKRDMERPVPMDRLVCGDVGYGKTEIAMRAAFKAVMGGKQVAFLAPTTILAEQHYENCLERFRSFPVKIERLSRFVPPAEQKAILARTAEGKVDILIGTHRIIQKDVRFRNLGLMIIDEEQRFGVKDKEKLKEMKSNIDCLTMSATPIPRTLHMSLLKIRDMSLLTTPPQNRQPIETVIDECSDDRIARAIRRETERGGQVFYLHNRVESLLETRRKIEQIVPEVLVDVAHGQMTSEQLDDIFHRFKMGGFHVLIATTIIENGIDIPNVNTIIIDRADMYGVSQLYQLRGRVGRSDRQAYAYLLYPENRALSEIAMKRLQVISDFTELGSGFKIAMKDMEIRGAGNLLGRDQSGDVYAVGFDMYVRLLNDAVNRLTAQNDGKPAEQEVLMELEYTGFIPDSYVQNPQTKMEIYKKIAAVLTDEEFESVLAEISDRFGPVPDEVSSLLALAEIRIICRKLSISSIRERQGEVRVEFAQASSISVEKILRLIKENPGTVRLNAATPNVVFIKLGKIGLKEKSEFIREKLSQLK